MEKVPEIRLFGTRQSFKKNIPSYNKEYVYSGFNDTWGQINHLKYQKYHLTPFQCNERPLKKPFETNYYQNAIKICEQNRVLDKNIHVQSYGFLRGNYLQYHNHQTPERQQCNKCQCQQNKCVKAECNNEDVIKKKSTKQITQQKASLASQKSLKSQGFKFNEKNQLDVYRKQNQKKNTLTINQNNGTSLGNTERQSITNYLMNDEETNKKITSKALVEPLHITNSTTNAISFKQITNKINSSRQSAVNNKYFVENVNNLGCPDLHYINTDRSQTNQVKNVSLASIQSNILDPQANRKTLIIKKIQSYANSLPNHTRIMQEFDHNESFESRIKNPKYMIQELEEMSRQNLQLNREYLHKLDQIIQKFEDKSKDQSRKDQQTARQKINQLIKIEIRQPIPESHLQNSQSLQSLNKRKKLFVTQSPYNQF